MFEKERLLGCLHMPDTMGECIKSNEPTLWQQGAVGHCELILVSRPTPGQPHTHTHKLVRNLSLKGDAEVQPRPRTQSAGFIFPQPLLLH